MSGAGGLSDGTWVCTDTTGAGSRRIAGLIERTGATAGLRAAGPGTAVILVPADESALPLAQTVHDAVDALADLGWARVVVGAVLSRQQADLGTVDVHSALREQGYATYTGAGSYEIVDLARDRARSDCPESSILFDASISAIWAGAGVRLVIARWSADIEDVFRACTAALAACVAEIPGAAAADVCADVARYLPPDFAVVEAVGSLHEAATLVAGRDIVSTDVVSAVLQGFDPVLSPSIAAAVRAVGLPGQLRVEESTPAPRRADPRAPDITLRRLGDRLPGTTRTMRVLMTPGQDDRDDTDDVLRALQRTVGPLVRPAESGGPIPPAVEGFAALFLTLADSLSAWRMNFAKDDVPRITAPLGYDPDEYTDDDYRSIPGYLASYTALLGVARCEEPWLRWCYFDGAVLFEVERVVNANFDEFVERVDVAEGISIMADYLGGRRVVVQRDDHHRPTMQAERNIYLPQPNYLAYWGGKTIDVCKIELAQYDADEHRLYWKTIASPNDSARYDDGVLTFCALPDDRTRITISGRQQFRLPVFWQMVDLDQYPAIKNELVTDAYRRFFSATFDNFEAHFEGRPYRIGTDATAQTRALPTEALSAYLAIGREWLTERTAAARRGGYEVDENGFRHFPGVAGPGAPRTRPAWIETARELIEEYAAALRADAGRPPRW